VQNTSAIMADDEEAEEHGEGDRGNREEIHVRPANELVSLVGDSPTKVKVSAL
jgi:hypothetical protein